MLCPVGPFFTRGDINLIPLLKNMYIQSVPNCEILQGANFQTFTRGEFQSVEFYKGGTKFGLGLKKKYNSKQVNYD